MCDVLAARARQHCNANQLLQWFQTGLYSTTDALQADIDSNEPASPGIKPGDAALQQDDADRPARALQVVQELHARYAPIYMRVLASGRPAPLLICTATGARLTATTVTFKLGICDRACNMSQRWQALSFAPCPQVRQADAAVAGLSAPLQLPGLCRPVPGHAVPAAQCAGRLSGEPLSSGQRRMLL